MNRFHCKTRIFSGEDILDTLRDLHPKRLMVVTDPYFYENGTAQRVAHHSGAAETAFFSRVAPDPTAELAAEGTAALRAFEPDVLVMLGGGSAMDLGKAMAYFSGERPLTVAIPTTSGSGSEVTDFAILTHDGIKHPLVDDSLQPDVAILDGSLLRSLPPKLVADCGFDALSHALEAFAATGASAVTDALAQASFCRIFWDLEASFRGDVTVRQGIHEASCMAAMAFNGAGLGLCHALAHSLGGAFHVPHGRLNAVLLPAVLDYNRQAWEKYGLLAAAAGLSSGARVMGLRNLKNGLIRLRKVLQLPGTLTEAGIDLYKLRSQMPRLVEAVLADPCCTTNPVPVDGAGVRALLEEVTGGG